MRTPEEIKEIASNFSTQYVEGLDMKFDAAEVSRVLQAVMTEKIEEFVRNRLEHLSPAELQMLITEFNGKPGRRG